jgi:hypothetical protein
MTAYYWNTSTFSNFPVVGLPDGYAVKPYLKYTGTYINRVPRFFYSDQKQIGKSTLPNSGPKRAKSTILNCQQLWVTAATFGTFFLSTMELYGGQLLKIYSHTKFSRYSIQYTVYLVQNSVCSNQYIDYKVLNLVPR